MTSGLKWRRKLAGVGNFLIWGDFFYCQFMQICFIEVGMEQVGASIRKTWLWNNVIDVKQYDVINTMNNSLGVTVI